MHQDTTKVTHNAMQCNVEFESALMLLVQPDANCSKKECIPVIVIVIQNLFAYVTITLIPLFPEFDTGGGSRSRCGTTLLRRRA